MTESIVVVISVLVIYGFFGLFAHKAEKLIRAQKAEERRLAAEATGKNKK